MLKPDYCAFPERDCRTDEDGICCAFYWPQQGLCTLMSDNELTKTRLNAVKLSKGGDKELKPNVLDLVPPARAVFYDFERAMVDNQVKFKVTCIMRTLAEQTALYAQHRQSTVAVNKLRAVAGLPSISDAENNRTVTWTMKSRHLPIARGSEFGKMFPDWVGLCYAWDIVILKADGKTPSWDIKVDVDADRIPDYEEAARIGEKLGLIVGARWRDKPDYPHYEFDLRRYYESLKK